MLLGSKVLYGIVVPYPPPPPEPPVDNLFTSLNPLPPPFATNILVPPNEILLSLPSC